MRTRINRGRFKLELAKRGLDQARFAQLAGLSATTISHASTGKTINPMTFSRIATALARVPPLVNAELVEEADSQSQWVRGRTLRAAPASILRPAGDGGPVAQTRPAHLTA
jgi:transcriptional regulator with XRE-family HTH domain